MASNDYLIKAVLFDVGGVAVLSPMLAIAAYEKANNIPPGYINHAIVRSSPNGAWSRIERGEIPFDHQFYEKFTADLSKKEVWDGYYRINIPTTTPSPMPSIDGKFLLWEMMRVSRNFDPYIAPAIQKMKQMKLQVNNGDGTRRRFVVGALTNDYQFPEGHEYNKDGFKTQLRELFDVFISSSAVGMRKPEQRIYELAVGRVGEVWRSWWGEEVKASEVVFLDDIGMNLKGAGKVGIRGIRVVLGESWRAVSELERVLGLKEGELFEEGVVGRLKSEGKWGEGKAKL
ncbi:HAD-like domain-containing protein [Tirmania nivea]|nr:HAD-like domain-containing protein [Tirmania nivea]